MIRLLASVAAAAIAASGAPVPSIPAPPPAPAPVPMPAPAPAMPAPGRMPGFAPLLADQPLLMGSTAWPRMSADAAWRTIARSARGDRQAARWRYASSLIGIGRGADALGVLDVMVADDPDLVLVAGWHRARGVALMELRRSSDALEEFVAPTLARDPETCLWRMRAFADAGDARAALKELGCAAPALDARDAWERRPFVMAAAGAAIADDRPQIALGWLAGVPDGNSAANLLRGKALLALGRMQEGRLRLERVSLTGTPEEMADAALTMIETGIATHTLTRPVAMKRLGQVLLGWRGGSVERRALTLAMRLADEGHDTRQLIVSGATLFRYFDNGAQAGSLAVRLQQALFQALGPASKLPLDQAAGLFWDYRDLAPTGADGFALMENLVLRLQTATLYARAADLLQYRLDSAAQDIEQGPLSIRIASLRILAGDPQTAIRVLRATDGYPYPNDMTADRRRVEAAALYLIGKPTEALAAVDDLPDSAPIRAEIYWRARDWQHLAAAGEPALPPPGRLNDVAQSIVLRQAIALAMLGREDGLARLRARYTGAFATLPTAAAFALLTGTPGQISPDALGKAMAALPSASLAGSFADLIDQGAAAATAAASATPAA